MIARWFSLLVLWGMAACAAPLSAQQTPQYDGLTAGEEAYRYHEARRRNDLARQLSIVDSLKAYSGASPTGPIPYIAPPGDAGETIYYRQPYGTAFQYGYGTGYSWRPPGSNYYGGPLGAYGFAHWPIDPSIWGYPYRASVPQPIGQQQVQTGPNRWESYPVWAPAAVPPTTPSGAAPPAAEQPPIPEPPSAGPREF